MAEASQFLGLSPASKVRETALSSDFIFTASSAQVRMPVYQNSSLKWLDFEDWILGDLDGVNHFEPPE